MRPIGSLTRRVAAAFLRAGGGCGTERHCAVLWVLCSTVGTVRCALPLAARAANRLLQLVLDASGTDSTLLLRAMSEGRPHGLRAGTRAHPRLARTHDKRRNTARTRTQSPRRRWPASCTTRARCMWRRRSGRRPRGRWPSRRTSRATRFNGKSAPTQSVGCANKRRPRASTRGRTMDPTAMWVLWLGEREVTLRQVGWHEACSDTAGTALGGPPVEGAGACGCCG